MKFRSIAIIGGGESGVGAALLAKNKGLEVFLSEYRILKDNFRKELEENKIPFEEKGHDFEKIGQYELVIKSPGVPDTAPIMKHLQKMGKTIVSEIEFASWFCFSGIVAITGSNGKTTTTSLIYYLMKTAGIDVQLGGNIGKSFARSIAEGLNPEWFVLEISSFQLDNIIEFKPNISVLLNITPDHLDRYEYQIENYANSKLRIAENQDEKDHFIFNDNDPIIQKMFDKTKALQFLHPMNLPDTIQAKLSTESGNSFDMSKCILKGRHNFFNALCAIKICEIIEIPGDKIQKGLNSFRNVPHRLERVAEINEVTFINDSKATNVDAVFYALQAFRNKIIWIAGGTDKGNDYTPLFDLVEEKVDYLICLGVDNEKLFTQFKGKIENISETQSIEEAVKSALNYAKPGDIVLLSPACASFDLFNNYEHRGDEFKKAVLKLKEKG